MGSESKRNAAILRAAERLCADRERERELLDAMRKCTETVYPSDVEWDDTGVVDGASGHLDLTDDARDRLGERADELLVRYDREGHAFEPCSRQMTGGYDLSGRIRERPLDPDEWCEACYSNLPAVEELRALRARKGGRMSALMRAFRMEVPNG